MWRWSLTRLLPPAGGGLPPRPLLVVGIAEPTVAIGWRRLLASASRDYLRLAGPQASH
jgi:hypothetical protein